MMKYTFLASIVLLWAPITLTAVEPKESKKVYIVASYEHDHICGLPQEQGVLKGLSKEGWFEDLNLSIQRYYMDTKKTHTSREAMKKQGEMALSKILDYKPDVVVTLDDNAFREVGLKLAGSQKVSVVFSGLNGQPEAYHQKEAFMKSWQQPGSNITGVYEKLYVTQALRVMANAVASLGNKKVVGITDYSPTGNAITKQFKLEIEKDPPIIPWELRRVKNWQDYVALIEEINEDSTVGAIYPVALTLKVTDEQTYTAPEIFSWTMEHSTKPEMALNYFFSKIGLFGGAAVDFKEMGILAGKKAGQILAGEMAGNLPIEDAPDYAIVFNQQRAQALGIDIPDALLTAADHVYR